VLAGPQPQTAWLADADAMAAFAAGDQHALRHLYERYGRLAHSIAHRISGDRATAEECTQDAFVALGRRAERFDPARGQVSTWLFAISSNLALGAVRRQRAPVEPDQSREVARSAGPDELVASADAAARLAALMANLPTSAARSASRQHP
jgi:RNA polymerase sigma-70 factor (ECF subfamily)